MQIQDIPADHVLAYFAVAPGMVSAKGIDPGIAKRYGGFGVEVGIIKRRNVWFCDTKTTDHNMMQVDVLTGRGWKCFHVDPECLLATTGSGINDDLLMKLRRDFYEKHTDLFE